MEWNRYHEQVGRNTVKALDTQKPLFHVLVVILFSLIAYSNTFSVPFHFDDESVIKNNPIVKDLRYFLEPSKAADFKGHFEYSTLKSRYVCYLTFALNYKVHGLDVTGYHVFNFLVHTGNALLVYLLVNLMLKTPFLHETRIKNYTGQIAVFTALVFASHPLQTQAVTYIWQRVTSLAALLYLLSLGTYVRWRLLNMPGSSSRSRRTAGLKTLPWYVASILAAVLAMKTKETAFMLPVTAACFELVFFRGNAAKRFLFLIPIFLTMLIIPFTLLGMDLEKPMADMLGEAGEAAHGATSLSRWEYMLSEFRVIVTYIRLVFLPLRQNLDYDYRGFHSFFDPEVLASFVFLSMIFGTGVLLLRRYRHVSPCTRLVSFGIFWFFINLFLESSVIPLNNVIFEHRMYLPSVGLFLAIISSLFIWVAREKEKQKQRNTVVVAALTVIVILLTGATYARNNVWRSERSLWEDVVRKSPEKSRGYTNLGNAYKNLGSIDKAIEQYRIAIELNPYDYKARSNLCLSYNAQGLLHMAMEQCRITIQMKPDYPSAYNNLGNTHLSMGNIDQAIEQYRIAVQLKPYFFSAHYNLGRAYQAQGVIDKAIEQYRTAIRLDRTSVKAYNNLGNAYRSQGLIDKAIEQYRMAIQLKPYAPVPHIGLGNAYMAKDLVDEAIEQYRIAIRLNPQNPAAHINLGIAYEAQGLSDKAGEHYEAASRLGEGSNAHGQSDSELKETGGR